MSDYQYAERTGALLATINLIIELDGRTSLSAARKFEEAIKLAKSGLARDEKIAREIEARRR